MGVPAGATKPTLPNERPKRKGTCRSLPARNKCSQLKTPATFARCRGADAQGACQERDRGEVTPWASAYGPWVGVASTWSPCLCVLWTAAGMLVTGTARAECRLILLQGHAGSEPNP